MSCVALLPLGEALRRMNWPGVAGDAGKDQPRGQPDNAGQFASGGGGGGGSSLGGAPGKSFADYKKQAGGDHKKAALEYYKNELVGHPAKATFGAAGEHEVKFTRDEIDKFKDHMANDPVKAEAIQHVRDVIENGKYLESTKSYKNNDAYSKYHHFQKEIPMKDENGKPRKLIVDVGQRKKDGAFEFVAHSFIHNKAGKNGEAYQKKVANLRAEGLTVEDKAIKKALTAMPGLTPAEVVNASSGHKISPSPASVNPHRRLLEGIRAMFASKRVANDADRWITVKPNGPDNKGQPALIGEGQAGIKSPSGEGRQVVNMAIMERNYLIIMAITAIMSAA